MKVSYDKRSNTLVRNTTKQNRARRENIIAQEGSGCTKLFEVTNYQLFTNAIVKPWNILRTKKSTMIREDVDERVSKSRRCSNEY